MKAQLNQTKKLYSKIALISIALISLTFFACEKDNTSSSSEDEFNNLINESYASEMFDEVEDLGDEAVDYLDNSGSTKSANETEGLDNYNRLSPCATITKVYIEDTVLVTIDFGDENCLCNDGRERRGKMYINHYGYYWGEGDVEIEFSFDNYFVDDNQLIGTRNVYRYMNENQHRVSEIICDGSVVLADDAGTITRHAEHVRELLEGSETHYKYDDVIQLTGSSNATLADGIKISGEITTPLIRRNEEGCFRYFVSGVRQIMHGEDEIIIDYGDGTCDNLAEFTKNGETHTYEIRHRQKFSW
jgi:hypothetical protein